MGTAVRTLSPRAAPRTQQADAEARQPLPQPVPEALRQLPPPLLLPGVVLFVQRQAVHVPGQAGRQVGDGRQGAFTQNQYLSTRRRAPAVPRERCSTGFAEQTSRNMNMHQSAAHLLRCV